MGCSAPADAEGRRVRLYGSSMRAWRARIASERQRRISDKGAAAIASTDRRVSSTSENDPTCGGSKSGSCRRRRTGHAKGT